MSELGSKGGRGLEKEVLQCGCIKENTKSILSGLAYQGGGINGVLNQEPCITDAKAELEAEEKERDPKRPVG